MEIAPIAADGTISVRPIGYVLVWVGVDNRNLSAALCELGRKQSRGRGLSCAAFRLLPALLRSTSEVRDYQIEYCLLISSIQRVALPKWAIRHGGDFTGFGGAHWPSVHYSLAVVKRLQPRTVFTCVGGISCSSRRCRPSLSWRGRPTGYKTGRRVSQALLPSRGESERRGGTFRWASSE